MASPRSAVATVALLAAISTGCTPGDDPDVLDGRGFTFSDPALPDNDVHIRFDDGEARWSAGCNGHEGRYEIVAGSLDYRFNTSDLGDCVETEAFEVFDDLLRDAPQALIDADGRLVLEGSRLTLAGRPDPDS